MGRGGRIKRIKEANEREKKGKSGAGERVRNQRAWRWVRGSRRHVRGEVEKTRKGGREPENRERG